MTTTRGRRNGHETRSSSFSFSSSSSSSRLMRATSTAREQRRRRRRWEDEKKKKEEEEERSGTRYEEEEEKEVEGGKESATTTASTPRMGYESVQRRLVEWKKEQRKEQRRTEEEEEEEEDGGEVSIEMQKKKKEREEEDAKKRRSQTTREEEKRAREEYLEQAPWKSPRLTARSARRRQKIEDDERRAKRCERKETVMSTPSAAEIYAKRCEEMRVRVSSRVLKALESETNGGTFDVSKEPLGDGGARAVASAIEEGRAQNESLIFAKCQVGVNGFHAICECALKVSKTFNLLKVLDLSDSIGVNCTFEDDQNLCNSKPSATVALLPSVFYQLLERLKVLKVNRCGIKGSIVKAIADALVSPKCTIEILELSRNALGNRGAKKIGDALITNRTLKKLDMSLNDITSRGGVSIANAARENLTLKELNISWNAIGDIGGKALGEALGSNRALRTLDISQCAIGEDATCAISKGLRKNTTLKVLKMDHTRCGETGGKKLMAMLTRNDCLTTLTLEGASFAGAIKVEDKGRQRQSRATKTADSSALKPSTRGNKQEKQQLNDQKKGKTSKARNELKNSTRMGDVYENTNMASSSSSSSEESDDDDDSADEDLFNISAVENEKHEQVLRTPRGSARNSNTTASLASEKLPLSELILPSWATSENSRARQMPIDEEDLLNLLQQLRSNRLSDFERVSRLQMVRSAYLFTSAQVARLTQTFFLPSSHRLAAAAACQPRLIDSENAIDVIYLKNGFGFRDYASANRKLEMLYGERNSQFRSQNPNGRYRFDLGIDADRALAQRMADIANEESSNQKFGGKCWRNVSVDDGPCVIESMCEKGTGIPKVFFSTPCSSSSPNEKRRKRTKTLKLPERGTLTFDYSSVVVYVDDNRRHDDNDVDDDYSILKLVRDVENVKTYLFDDNGEYEENANKNDGELYSSNLRMLRAKACTLWFHPTAVKKLIFYFPKGAFRVEAIVALFGRIPLHLRDDFSRDVFSLGHLSGIEQCVLGSRLGWRSVLGTHMDKLTFRCRLDCACEEDLNVAKYLCEKASEANADAHCRVRNVLVNDRRLAKDPVQDVSLWSVLTAESSTPLLEFDYFGEDEGILRELLERELAPAVQNGSASARGREQSSLATTKKESSFNLQLRKLGNKLNFSRACEVHRWRKNNAVDTNIERSKVAEKNSSNIAADGAKKKLKSKAKQKKKTKKKKAASAPPSSSLPPPSRSLSSPTLRGGNPYETFYASYFLPSFESNTNVLKNIFSSLDQDGGGTLSLYEFKKGATDVLGVKIDRKILEPYFSAVAEQQQQQGGGENNNTTKIDFRAFQEGVVEYDTFEKICSEWMDDEEAKEKERNVY